MLSPEGASPREDPGASAPHALRPLELEEGGGLRPCTPPPLVGGGRLKVKNSDFVRSPPVRAVEPPSLLGGAREVILGSRLNVLALLTPAAMVAASVQMDDGVIFTLALLAIAPFAERLGFVTEQLAMHTNDTLGGLLNATFGNATELIISVFALLRGRPGADGAVLVGPRSEDQDAPGAYRRLVQVSLLGSVLSNLLLVFGSALVVGGARFKEQRFNKMGAGVSTALLLLVATALGSPLVLLQGGQVDDAAVLSFSRFASGLLLLLYGFFLAFQLVTHRYFYEDQEEDGSPAIGPPGTVRFELLRKSSDELDVSELGCDDPQRVTPAGAASGPGSQVGFEEPEEEELVLGFRAALCWLAVISVAISVLSEYLVDAIKGAAISWDVSQEFIGAILIPVVGNAAEHASAVVFAYRNKMDIALGVALGSATQIGVLVLPTCVLLGWWLGTPLTLLFEPFEVLALFAATLLVGVMVRDGTSHWLYGVVLMFAYLLLAAGFWFHA